MLTLEQIQELRKLEKAATVGPWEFRATNMVGYSEFAAFRQLVAAHDAAHNKGDD